MEDTNSSKLFSTFILLSFLVILGTLAWSFFKEGSIVELNEIEISRNNSVIDSLNCEIMSKSYIIDSLDKCIDSFKLKYEVASLKYELLRDSIKSLDLDESINFLKQKIEEYEINRDFNSSN